MLNLHNQRNTSKQCVRFYTIYIVMCPTCGLWFDDIDIIGPGDEWESTAMEGRIDNNFCR